MIYHESVGLREVLCYKSHRLNKSLVFCVVDRPDNLKCVVTDSNSVFQGYGKPFLV